MSWLFQSGSRSIGPGRGNSKQHVKKKKKKPRGERGSGAGKLIQRVLVRKLYFILGIRPLEVKLGQ